MKLSVLGCSGTVPSDSSGCSSYLVQHEGYNLLIDMGSGSLAQFRRRLDFPDIDTIVLSHMHGDHWLDLVLYTYMRRYDRRATAKPLRIFAPYGAERIVRAALNWSEHEFDLTAYQFVPLETGVAEIGPLQVRFARVSHPVDTFALRVSDGRSSLAYSADTGECGELVELARDVDMFLCEAALEEGEDLPGIHLTAAQAGEHAARAGAHSLVLTHLRPWTDARDARARAAATFGGDVRVAEAGECHDF